MGKQRDPEQDPEAGAGGARPVRGLPGGLPGVGTVDAATVIADELLANRTLLGSLEGRELVLVAGLVDAAPRPTGGRRPLPGGEGMAQLGGEGTPRVPEFLAMELGALFGCTHASAALLIADALDLRHRHPRLWRLVEAGQVRAWQARRVAAMAHPLSIEQADELDAVLAPVMPGLGWTRMQRLVEGEIARIAPALIEARSRAAREHRFVRLGREKPGPGVTALVAHLDTVDAVHVDAAVDQLAGALARHGDDTPLDSRRARALGLLATPALAAALLTDLAEPDQPVGPPTASDCPEPSDRQQSLPIGPLTEPDDPESLPPDPGPDAADAAEAGPTARSWWRARAADLATAFSTVDPDRLRPVVRLHVHVSAADLEAGSGVARVEGHGPVPLSRLAEFLGGCSVRVTQVIDTRDVTAVDSYEIPDRIREQVVQLQPYEVFPWGQVPARSCDIDHSVPWRAGGVTAIDNLGPLGRRAHRARTHGRFRLDRTGPGTWVWRSPLGYVYSVSNRSTRAWGRWVSGLEATWLHNLPAPPPPPVFRAAPDGPAAPPGPRPVAPPDDRPPARPGPRPTRRTRSRRRAGSRARRRTPPRSARRSGSGGRRRPRGPLAGRRVTSRRRARHRAGRAAS